MTVKIIPIKQSDSIACGPTCIKMASDYFQKTLALSQIAKVSNYKRKGGLSNIDLVNTLEILGFNVETKSNASWLDLKRLNTKDKVVILSWMLDGYIGHFSVLESVNGQKITLADPLTGTYRKLDKLIFLRLWFDYDELWYPTNNTDIQLRWLVVVSIPSNTRDLPKDTRSAS